jgi:DNA-binding Xre family transcriptional regulator
MIKAKIREIAEAKGVPNAYQLGELIGVTPNVSARLWKDSFAQIGRVTLEKLCSALECQVGDLLVYEPEKKMRPLRGKAESK